MVINAIRSLPSDSITQKFCVWLAEDSKNNPKIKSIILFGSRARGDHNDRSDFDLAVSAPSWSHSEWAGWVESLKEKAPTLLGLDLVRIESITNSELLNKTQTEGIIIYEKR